jgi:hypothetical protein
LLRERYEPFDAAWLWSLSGDGRRLAVSVPLKGILVYDFPSNKWHPVTYQPKGTIHELHINRTATHILAVSSSRAAMPTAPANWQTLEQRTTLTSLNLNTALAIEKNIADTQLLSIVPEPIGQTWQVVSWPDV